MELLGYAASLLIGVFLGLLGGGGSVLAVPVLVYLFHLDILVAITSSLLIVGLSSLFGSFSYFKSDQVDFRVALLFGIPSIVVVIVTRAVLVPLLPEALSFGSDLQIAKRQYLLGVFSLLMMISAYKMIQTQAPHEEQEPPQLPQWVMGVYGGGVGFVTGIIGVGGGFLIVPALTLLGQLKIRTAIGTSLAIIAANSLFGFASSLLRGGEAGEVSWPLMLGIVAVSAVGVGLGALISKRLSSQQLKPAFGWFILIMGVGMMIAEMV